MAAELLLAGQLPIGSSRAESELLLQQTQEALQAQLDVQGVFDLRPALEAAASGGILNARQLEGVASSMEAAFELRAAACATAPGSHQPPARQAAGSTSTPQQQQQQEQEQQEGVFLHPGLAQLAAGIQPRELATLTAIRSCIRDGEVVSEASEEQAAVRQARQANREAARELATRIARDLHAQGAMEGRDAMLLRGRYCVAVKRSRRSAVSKGSVKLGESGTGSTLYLEPAEVLELNNREAQLADEEQQAELAVLQAITQFLAQRTEAIRGMLAAVTALDITAARAKHAQWCSGVRPILLDDSSSSSSNSSAASPMFLPGARHPLLLQPSLPPLPRPPSADDASFATDFVPPPLFAFAAAAAASSTSSSDSDGEDGAAGPAQQGPAGARPAQPLELVVPAAAKVVAITGPNTGGKTVTLKTAGLLGLMVKAGLFVPCDRQQLEAAAAAAGGGGEAGAGGSGGPGLQPAVLWFDQVLADIGDSQSLQQNLSTFSGHIARLKLLLAAAGARSLVLLDEVGSGTDPLEGSALARAVLDVLAGQARLTLATSHHAELKTAADEDSRYVNVSLEFNTLTLQPTYRLRWGSAGSSNALDIAQALGFAPEVLAEARVLARAELGKQEQQRGRMEEIAASVEDQLAAARASLAALTAERQQHEQRAAELQTKYEELLAIRRKFSASERLIPREAAQDVLRLQTAAVKLRRGRGSLDEVQAAFDACAAKVGRSLGGGGGGGLKAGDLVAVPSMSVVSPFFGRVAKVVGDTVYLEGAANPLFSNKKPQCFSLDEVVPAELLNVPVAGEPPASPSQAGP